MQPKQSGFVWQIPSLTQPQQDSLLSGYIRNINAGHKHNVIQVILDLCAQYFCLNDPVSIDDILHSTENAVLKSAPFEIYCCEWRLCLFFRRATIWQCIACNQLNQETQWYCNQCNQPFDHEENTFTNCCTMSVGLEITRLPDTVNGITANTHITYFYDGQKVHKCSKWKFTLSNPIQRYWNLVINTDDIRRSKQFKLMAKLSLIWPRTEVDHTSLLMQYNLVKSISDSSMGKIMDRFDELQSQLNAFRKQLQRHEAVLTTPGNEQLCCLKTWLTNKCKLSQYFQLFVENGIEDLDTAKLLTLPHLQSIGVSKLGHRLKIMQQVELLSRS